MITALAIAFALGWIGAWLTGRIPPDRAPADLGPAVKDQLRRTMAPWIHN